MTPSSHQLVKLKNCQLKIKPIISNLATPISFMTDESSVTKVTHDRTKIAFGFSFRNHSFSNKIFHHFGRIVELLSFRLELKIWVKVMSHHSWLINNDWLTVVIRSKMAVNGARVSSLNRTARSAIDTANLKIGGSQSFHNVHSLFECNYRLTAITRDRRERGLRSRGPGTKILKNREPKILKCRERYLKSVPVDLWLWPHLTLCDL